MSFAYGWAQSDPLYTQYRSNMMAVNPAYAGSRDALTLGYLYRNQWVNIEGAPTTQTVTVHGPINNNLGLGVNVTHDEIGPTSQTGTFLAVSGRIKLGNSTYLAGGVQGGIDYLSSNFSSITTGTGGDNAFNQDVTSILPNVGAGIYLYSNKFYAGFSIPKIVTSVLYDDGAFGGDIRQKRHYFGILGYVFDLSPNIQFKPTFLARYVAGAPASYDLTTTFILADKFWLGAFYRLNESTGAILGYNITPQLKVGYSYDFTLSELVDYNAGSHEFTLTYDFIFKSGRKIRSPRYF
jgi:type IX secretion system PorP/SprF family membrane protein